MSKILLMVTLYYALELNGGPIKSNDSLLFIMKLIKIRRQELEEYRRG